MVSENDPNPYVGGAPWPENGWDEIIPGLFQGGQVRMWQEGSKFSDFECQRVRVGTEFDAVYSFFSLSEEWDGPAGGVEHVHYPIPDGELEDGQLTQLRVFASVIARQLDAGERVLVRCQAGYNRSGLVVAFVLMELGWNVHDAVDLIRAKRSSAALHRPVFIRYLLEAAGELP